MLGFEFSIQSSVYDATTVAKVSLFSTRTQSTVSFYSMYAQKLTHFAVNKHRQFNTQTDFPYLGLVNLSMTTGTCCSLDGVLLEYK